MGTDIPAYRESYWTGSVQATSPVGDDEGISSAEATAQAAGYLGYLANLVIADDEGNLPEIDRVYKIIQGYIDEGKISKDSKIGKLIIKLVGILAPSGKPTPGPTGSVVAFADAYEGFGKSGTPPIVEINNWFQNGGFDFSTESSPDTAFAYLMFMTSAVEQLPRSPDQGLEEAIKAFFGQEAPPGFPNAAELSSEFLAAVCKTEPGMKGKIDKIFEALFTLVPNPPEEFQKFYNTFTGDGPYSYNGLPDGITPEGVMVFLQNYIPGPTPGT